MSVKASDAPQLNDANAGKVVKALGNDNYVWRTLSGLASETELDESVVLDTLHSLPPDMLATTTGREGPLFTTKQHYTEKQSFLGRVLTFASGTYK